MARKTTQRALEALDHFDNSLKHYEEVLRVKRLPLENQADFIKSKSLDYYEGWIVGILTATENLLHRCGCYHGFHYVDSKGNWLTPEEGQSIDDHPEYRNFRVKFFTK